MLYSQRDKNLQSQVTREKLLVSFWSWMQVQMVNVNLISPSNLVSFQVVAGGLNLIYINSRKRTITFGWFLTLTHWTKRETFSSISLDENERKQNSARQSLWRKSSPVNQHKTAVNKNESSELDFMLLYVSIKLTVQTVFVFRKRTEMHSRQHHFIPHVSGRLSFSIKWSSLCRRTT